MDLNTTTVARYKLPDAKLTEAAARFLEQKPFDVPFYQRCIRMSLVDYMSNPDDYSYFGVLDQVVDSVASAYASRNQDDFVQFLSVYRFEQEMAEAIPPITQPPRHLIMRLVLALLEGDAYTMRRLVREATPQVELPAESGLEALLWKAIVLLLQSKRSAYESALVNLDKLVLSGAFSLQERAVAGAWSGIARAVLSGSQEQLASAITARNEACTRYITKELKRWMRSGNTELIPLDFFDHATTALLLAANRSIPYFRPPPVENAFADIGWLAGSFSAPPLAWFP